MKRTSELPLALTVKQRLAVSRHALAAASHEPVWVSVLQRCVQHFLPAAAPPASGPERVTLKTPPDQATNGRIPL